MLLRPAQVREVLCRVLVPALLLWLSGAGALACCAEGAQAASAYGQEYAEVPLAMERGESPDAACCSEQHCQSSNDDGRDALSTGSRRIQRASGAMPCCSTAERVADRARKSGIAPERIAFQTRNDRSLKPNYITFIEIVANRTRILDDTAAYLRHCVLLI